MESRAFSDSVDPPNYPWSKQIADAIENFDDQRCVEAMDMLGINWRFETVPGEPQYRAPTRAELRTFLFSALRNAAMQPGDYATLQRNFVIVRMNDRMTIAFAPYGASTFDTAAE